VGKKFGEAKIALQVANSAPEKATPLVLALLEHLVPVDMSKVGKQPCGRRESPHHTNPIKRSCHPRAS